MFCVAKLIHESFHVLIIRSHRLISYFRIPLTAFFLHIFIILHFFLTPPSLTWETIVSLTCTGQTFCLRSVSVFDNLLMLSRSASFSALPTDGAAAGCWLNVAGTQCNLIVWLSVFRRQVNDIPFISSRHRVSKCWFFLCSPTWYIMRRTPSTQPIHARLHCCLTRLNSRW